MDRADPRAGEHGVGAFGHHRHVDRDPVALRDAHRLERIGHANDFGLQFGISDTADSAIGRIGFENQRQPITMARIDMTIDRVVANVEGAVLEPFDRHRIKGPVGDFRRLSEPVETFGLAGPECVRVFDAARIEGLIIPERAICPFNRCGGPLDPFRTLTCLGHSISPLPPSSLGNRREGAIA